MPPLWIPLIKRTVMTCEYVRAEARGNVPMEDDDSTEEEEDTKLDDEDDFGSN